MKYAYLFFALNINRGTFACIKHAFKLRFVGKSRKLNDGTLNKLMTFVYGAVAIHNSNLQPPPEPDEKPTTSKAAETQDADAT